MQRLAVALALLTGLALAQQSPAPTDYAALGKQAVQQLAAREYAKVEAQFDATMAAALPQAKLQAMWEAVQQQLGAFQSVTRATASDAGGHQVVIVTCQFANKAMGMQLSFDPDGKVAGLFFVPPAGGQPPAPAWTPPSYANPGSFHETQVTIRDDGFALTGTLTMPDLARPRDPNVEPSIGIAGVVLVSGSGPNDADETIGPNKVFKDLAWGLASRGIAVLRYPKRTNVYGARSAADMNAFTVNDEYIDDARAAAALLAAQPEVDPLYVYILGHSEGGYLAPRIAAGDKTITGMIVMAGPTRPIEQEIVDQYAYLLPLEGADAAATAQAIADVEQKARLIESPNLKPGTTVYSGNAPLPSSYVLDLRGYDPTTEAKHLKIPILFLQGARDYQVRVADYDAWKSALAADHHATFHLYRGLTHLFMPSSTPGDGLGTPSDYTQPSHISAAVIADIANWAGYHPPPYRQ